MKSKLILALLATALMGTASAQAIKVEDAIKWRQSAYQVLSWNMNRLKANVEGQFNKDEVVKAGNTIAAIANSGMGSLYVPGSDKSDKIKTNVRPEMFTNHEAVGKVAMAFAKEANEMAKVAATGDAAAVKAQMGKLGGTCKACHDDFKQK